MQHMKPLTRISLSGKRSKEGERTPRSQGPLSTSKGGNYVEVKTRGSHTFSFSFSFSFNAYQVG